MTHTEIIYQRRLAVLEHARRTRNVAETCRVFGISRTRYYEWKNRADLYGLDALMPKEGRTPQMPSATPTHILYPGAGHVFLFQDMSSYLLAACPAKMHS